MCHAKPKARLDVVHPNPEHRFEQKSGNKQCAQNCQKLFLARDTQTVCEIEQPCNQRIRGQQFRLHHQADDGNDRRQPQQIHQAINEDQSQ